MRTHPTGDPQIIDEIQDAAQHFSRERGLSADTNHCGRHWWPPRAEGLLSRVQAGMLAGAANGNIPPFEADAAIRAKV